LRASRSSGPGGQHANVTASRIEAIFDVAASTGLSDEQKRRVTARLGWRVVAVAQDQRSQATKPTRSSVQRRLDAKRRQATRKRDRRQPGAED
jgi:ribosome-associated protein